MGRIPPHSIQREPAVLMDRAHDGYVLVGERGGGLVNV